MIMLTKEQVPHDKSLDSTIALMRRGICLLKTGLIKISLIYL